MKNFFYFAAPAAVVIFLFFSFINVIGKTMKTGQNQSPNAQTSDLLQAQSEKNDAVQDQQKRLMEDRKRQYEEQKRMLRDRQRGR